jgi:mRNA interferase RelE/StbE
MYEVAYTASAAKQIRKLDRVARDRVLRTIEILRGTPRPPRSVRLVGSSDLWRVRTGNYRIIYRVEDERLLVVVVKVGHRGDVYR